MFRRRRSVEDEVVKGNKRRKNSERSATMDRTTDSEMSEAAASSTPPGGGNDGVRDLLALARRLVDEGNPSQALQAVTRALQTTGGNEAAFQFLARAREMYRTRLHASTAVDELASVFAECVIAEVQSSSSIPVATPVVASASAVPPPELVSHGNSILAESGRMQVVMDAFADGSSFICLKCGGLVSNHRKDEHYAYWCD